MQQHNQKELDKGAHSVYTLRYHIIWCVKYRRRLLSNTIGDRLKEIVKDIVDSTGCWCEAVETDKDHIHIMLRTKPTHNIANLLKLLKGISARLLLIEYPELRQSLRNGHLWSPSYYAATVGEVTKETVKHYIDSQREQDQGRKTAR